MHSVLQIRYARGPAPGIFFWGRMFYEICKQARFNSKCQKIFAAFLCFSGTHNSHRRAAAGEVFFGEVCKNKSISPYKAISPAYQKTGQPPWVVRFSDNIGANIISPFAFFWLLPTVYRLPFFAYCTLRIVLFKAFRIPPNAQKSRHFGVLPSDRARPQSSNNSSAPKEIPRRRPPGIPCLQHSMQNWGPCAGEVWAGEAPEGPASPKGFTGWDGPGKFEADFSSGE